MIGSLLPTILCDINEKSVKLIEKNLQVDNYQLGFKEFDTSLQENLGLKNFDSSWCPKGWSHTLLLYNYILRFSIIRPTKFWWNPESQVHMDHSTRNKWTEKTNIMLILAYCSTMAHLSFLTMMIYNGLLKPVLMVCQYERLTVRL